MKELKEEFGAKTGVEYLVFDVRNKEEVFNQVDSLPTEFKKIDILINNAGNAHGFDTIDEGSPDDWDAMIDINVKGLLYVSKAIIPGMVERKSGHVINIGSVAGKEVYVKGNVYCASKFALIGLTQALAKELAQYDVNVNAVCPGIVHTFMWDQLLGFFAEEEGIQKVKTFDETFQGLCEKLIPLKRPQNPEDIANVVLFLSSEVSKNITGEAISINGGLQMD